MPLPDPRLATGLGRAFELLGLTRAAIARYVERGDDLRGPLKATREAMFSDDPIATAMRLLFCREAVPFEETVAALGKPLAEQATGAGILEECAGKLQAPLHLRIVDGLYLFSDYLGEGAAADAVMGAGETTAILYHAAKPTGRCGAALDLGCGAGPLALLLARDCDFALGTDVNARAVHLAQMNAAVNDIANVEFRTGSLWEPVGGQRFDCIVSQPPYYPRKAGAEELTFLHGGERGDEIALGVVNGVGAHLAPGGRALVFASWPDERRPFAEDMRVLELTANRRELSGSKQALNVLEHPRTTGPWHMRTEVSAECWGNVRPHHIDYLMANGDAVRSGVASPLRLAPGLKIHAGSDGAMLRGIPGSLFTLQPLTPQQAEALQLAIEHPEQISREDREAFLARGWLTIA